MQFEEFERRAWSEWERIPTEYKHGVDGLIVERRALPHPELPEVYTLGECLTESYPSEFGGPDTTRSAVVLYYGSFFRLSRLDPEFDWEQELWETLTHELQHHLESLATDDSLIDMDYAADENFKRQDSQPFDPLFYRSGMREPDGYRVEDEFFIEVEATAGNDALRFTWDGAQYEVKVLPPNADVTFVQVLSGVDRAPAALYLVLVKATHWRDAVASLFRRRTPTVAQLEAEATLLQGEQDANA